MSRRALILAALALLGFDLAFLGDALFSDALRAPVDLTEAVAPFSSEGVDVANPLLSDWSRQFQPWRRMVREAWMQGDVPLWNARAGAGQPLAANMQSEAFSPYLPIALVFGEQASDWKLLAQLLIAQIFTLLLMRRLGCGATAALVAALGYSYGSYMQAWSLHPHAGSAAFAPAILLGLIKLREASSRAPGFLLVALATAASVLAGHLETAAKAGVGAFLVALVLGAWTPRALGRYLGLGLSSAALGLLLCAVLLLPFLDYLGQSDTEQVRSLSPRPGLHVAQILTLFDAKALGSELDESNPYRGDSNSIEGVLHLGSAAFLLALFGLLRSGRRRGLALLLPIALGLIISHAPPALAERLVSCPPLDRFPLPRMSYLALLPLALASAFGVEAILRGEARRLLALLGPVLALSLFVLQSFDLSGGAEIRASVLALIALIPPLLAWISPRRELLIGLVVGILAAEAWISWRDFVPRQSVDRLPTSSAIFDGLDLGPSRIFAASDTLPPELSSLVDLSALRSYDAVGLARHERLLRLGGGFFGVRWSQASAGFPAVLADITATRWLLTPWPGERARRQHRREYLAPGQVFELVFPAPPVPVELMLSPLLGGSARAEGLVVEFVADEGRVVWAAGEERTEGLAPGAFVAGRDAALGDYLRLNQAGREVEVLSFQGRQVALPLRLIVTAGKEPVELSQLGPGAFGDLRELRQEGGLWLSERSSALPFAFVGPEPAFVTDRDAAIARLLEPSFDPRAELLVEGESDVRFSADATRALQALPLSRPSAEEIIVDWGGDAAGSLVVCEAWAPGWRAEADGEELSLRPANVVAQVVAVPAGTREIRLVYEPASFRLGAALSTLALLIVFVLALRVRLKPSV